MGLRVLNADELESYATKISRNEQVDISPLDLTDQSNLDLSAVVSKKMEEMDEEAAKAVKDPLPDPVPEDDGVPQLAGGIVVPDGYTLVGTITAHDEDGSQKFNVSNLLPNATVIRHTTLASVTFNRSPVDSTQGYIEGRIIHDGGARAYVFRYDDYDEGLTIFSIRLTTQGMPIT